MKKWGQTFRRRFGNPNPRGPIGIVGAVGGRAASGEGLTRAIGPTPNPGRP
jgi:hypothetical protein